MAFSCRICKDKFNLSRLLYEPNAVSEGYNVVSTQCGHLFHRKCLEGALTNQKLLHARHGTGPLRRFCPVAKCNAEVKNDESIIPISFAEDENRSASVEVDGGDNRHSEESKLVKKVQQLMSERDRLSESLQRADNEAELLRSAVDEIKFDLSEIQSFLKDDRQMRKGDLIFWITKDGTYAPGKVLEIRKKPGETDHYAIVKLDNKTKVPGIGPHAANRDTLILPVPHLITFKSFFCDFFDQFQAKFEAILVDLNAEIQELSSPSGGSSSSGVERSAAYYRSTRKMSKSNSNSKTNILNALGELDSSISVESVPIPSARRHSQPQTSSSSSSRSKSIPQTTMDLKGTKITRSSTIHYGERERPRRLEKCRSKSWANPPTRPLLESPNEMLELEMSRSFNEKEDSIAETPEESELGFYLGKEEEEEYLNLGDDDNDNEDPVEFIRVGERVIWFDTYSDYEQVGRVAAVCEYSPCAIVHFEEHPIVKHKFQFRTVPLNELFPYDLASPEDKLRIAEIYGKIEEFVESREHMFVLSNDESASECEEILDFNLGTIRIGVDTGSSET